MLVLIVEDSHVARKMLELSCQGLGYETLTAGSGAEAMKLMNHEVRCILMDLCLPGPDGWDVTQRILRWFPHTYVIAVTSNRSAEHQQYCYQVGMAEFLIKPVDVATLREALARAEKYSR